MTSDRGPEGEHLQDHFLTAARLAKVEALRAGGVDPYPVLFTPTADRRRPARGARRPGGRGGLGGAGDGGGAADDAAPPGRAGVRGDPRRQRPHPVVRRRGSAGGAPRRLHRPRPRRLGGRLGRGDPHPPRRVERQGGGVRPAGQGAAPSAGEVARPAGRRGAPPPPLPGPGGQPARPARCWRRAAACWPRCAAPSTAEASWRWRPPPCRPRRAGRWPSPSSPTTTPSTWTCTCASPPSCT